MSARTLGIGLALVVTVGMVSAGMGTAPMAHAGPAAPYAVREEVEPNRGYVGLSQEAVDAFNALKDEKKFRFVVLKFDKADTQIVVEKTSSSTEYDDFTEALQARGAEACSYGFYDFEYERDGKRHRKIFVINWSPDTAKIRQRMLYSKGWEAVKSTLTGATFHEASDDSDLSYEALLAKASA